MGDTVPLWLAKLLLFQDKKGKEHAIFKKNVKKIPFFV